jgi:hypothetical protein
MQLEQQLKDPENLVVEMGFCPICKLMAGGLAW